MDYRAAGPQALAAAPGLVRLDLSGNLLEDDKARLLAGGLARARVNHLSLSHNRVRSGCCCAALLSQEGGTTAQSFKCASAAASQLCRQSGFQALCASAIHSRRDALTASACICYCRSGTFLCVLLSARVTHKWSGMYVRSRKDVSFKLCAVLRCLSVAAAVLPRPCQMVLTGEGFWLWVILSCAVTCSALTVLCCCADR